MGLRYNKPPLVCSCPPNHTIVSLELLLRGCRPSRDCWVEGTLADFGMRSITRWLFRRHSWYSRQWYLKDTWGHKGHELPSVTASKCLPVGQNGVRIGEKRDPPSPKLPKHRRKAACDYFTSHSPFFTAWKIRHPASAFPKSCWHTWNENLGYPLLLQVAKLTKSVIVCRQMNRNVFYLVIFYCWMHQSWACTVSMSWHRVGLNLDCLWKFFVVVLVIR